MSCFMLYYCTFILVIPVFIFSLICQANVKSNYKKYSQIISRTGMTGADAAWRLLQLNGVTDVRIKKISGNLTDHYDPKAKEICLSAGVFDSRSIAAIGIACHEAGHACQHAQNYGALKIRNAVIPATKIGTSVGIPLCLIGMFINIPTIAYVGLIAYGFVAFFQFVTLPVEFNASKRALQTIEQNHFLIDNEVKGAKKVLGAAAMTYVAALASVLVTILRLLIVINGGGRR